MWDKDWLIQFPKVSFAPNDKLFSMGEPIRYNYYLIDGICAKVLPSADGKDAILAYCEKGRMVGVHIKRQKQDLLLISLQKQIVTATKFPVNI